MYKLTIVSNASGKEVTLRWYKSPLGIKRALYRHMETIAPGIVFRAYEVAYPQTGGASKLIGIASSNGANFKHDGIADYRN